LITIFVPYASTVATGVVIPIIKAYIDTKGTFDHFQTKKTSRAPFKAVYSGSDYIIHFKYSGILNIVYIAFMYGLGLPLLFPIAAASIFS